MVGSFGSRMEVVLGTVVGVGLVSVWGCCKKTPEETPIPPAYQKEKKKKADGDPVSAPPSWRPSADMQSGGSVGDSQLGVSGPERTIPAEEEEDQKKIAIKAGLQVDARKEEYQTMQNLNDDDIWGPPVEVGGGGLPPAATKEDAIKAGKKVDAYDANYQTLADLNDDDVWGAPQPPQQQSKERQEDIWGQPAGGTKEEAIKAGKKVAAEDAQYQTLADLNDDAIWGDEPAPPPRSPLPLTPHPNKEEAIKAGKKVDAYDANYQTLAGLNDDAIWA